MKFFVCDKCGFTLHKLRAQCKGTFSTLITPETNNGYKQKSSDMTADVRIDLIRSYEPCSCGGQFVIRDITCPHKWIMQEADKRVCEWCGTKQTRETTIKHTEWK